MKTSTRRLGRSAAWEGSFEGDAHGDDAVLHRRQHVGHVAVEHAVVDADLHRQAGAQAARVRVGDRRVDAERAQVGDARHDVALAHGRALLGERPRDHAVAIGRRRGQAQHAARLLVRLLDLRQLEREAVEFGLRGLLRVAARGLDALQLDAGLALRHLRLPKLLSRGEAFLEQLLVALVLEPGGLQLQLLDLDLGVELGERVLEGQLRARLLVGLERQVLAQRLDREDRGVDVQLDDRTRRRFTAVPAFLSTRMRRASTGLDRTCSVSGTTVPVAERLASTGPWSTMAVRIDERFTDGRSSPLPQLTSSPTEAMTAAGTSSRFSSARYRVRVSISRSTQVPPRPCRATWRARRSVLVKH